MADEPDKGNLIQVVESIRDVIFWAYNNFCASHPVVYEVLFLVVVLAVCHVGYTYVRQNAPKHVVIKPSEDSKTGTVNNTVTTHGDEGPGLAGQGNSVQYDKSESDSHGKKER